MFFREYNVEVSICVKITHADNIQTSLRTRKKKLLTACVRNMCESLWLNLGYKQSEAQVWG